MADPVGELQLGIVGPVGPTSTSVVSAARPALAERDDAPADEAFAHDFETLFRAHHSELCAFAYRFVGSVDEARDVVQDVFMTVWRRRAVLRAEMPTRGYLYRATRNVALHRLRHVAVEERHALLEHADEIDAGTEDRFEAVELQHAA